MPNDDLYDRIAMALNALYRESPETLGLDRIAATLVEAGVPLAEPHTDALAIDGQYLFITLDDDRTVRVYRGPTEALHFVMITPETMEWPGSGPLDSATFGRMMRHARMAVVESYRACDFEMAKPGCPTEPYLMTNLVVAILTGAGYKDLLEKQGADAARYWLEHALSAISSEVTATTSQRMKINIEIRESPSAG